MHASESHSLIQVVEIVHNFSGCRPGNHYSTTRNMVFRTNHVLSSYSRVGSRPMVDAKLLLGKRKVFEWELSEAAPKSAKDKKQISPQNLLELPTLGILVKIHLICGCQGPPRR